MATSSLPQNTNGGAMSRAGNVTAALPQIAAPWAAVALAAGSPLAPSIVAGGGRRVTVRLDSGYPAAQVFAPATDDVICFEPMTAPTNALRSGDRLPLVGPGERYCAAFSVSAER